MDDSSASAILPAVDAESPEIEGSEPSVELPVENPDPVRSLPPRAKCIWCGASVKYATETDAREFWGYCSAECRTDFLGELDCDPEKAFNKSRRKQRRAAPPAFVQARRAKREAEEAAEAAAAPDAEPAVDPEDDLAEPE